MPYLPASSFTMFIVELGSVDSVMAQWSSAWLRYHTVTSLMQPHCLASMRWCSTGGSGTFPNGFIVSTTFGVAALRVLLKQLYLLHV